MCLIELVRRVCNRYDFNAIGMLVMESLRFSLNVLYLLGIIIILLESLAICIESYKFKKKQNLRIL